MSKTSPKAKRGAEEITILSTLPWTCTNFGDQSEIESYVPATGKWETIADVHSIGSIDAEDIADFINRAVTAYVESKAK